jgi:hypothetical protein
MANCQRSGFAAAGRLVHNFDRVPPDYLLSLVTLRREVIVGPPHPARGGVFLWAPRWGWNTWSKARVLNRRG